ncbi:acyltransferase [Pseudomonas sp. Irchel 3H7]|uniref:acyltransferase family protein n=1 Tax=Pseudomonas sp. Irchel 3H7 TaxID=2009042 RepID=UPI0021149CD0|nr:acyltransferase [Pseudomonas sp. Irchel 3H7]
MGPPNLKAAQMRGFRVSGARAGQVSKQNGIRFTQHPPQRCNFLKSIAVWQMAVSALRPCVKDALLSNCQHRMSSQFEGRNQVHKLTSLQAARGLAALLVVAFHSIFINTKYLQSELIIPELFVFGQTGVDLFFALSGFVMIIAFRKKFGLRGETLNFLKGRFLRIYPTYWVYFLAVLLVFIIRPELVNNSQSGHSNILSSFLLLPEESAPLVMVAWSLTHEIWFYLVFALILKLPVQYVSAALLVWLLAIITHEFSIEFILGALSGVAYLKLAQRGLKRIPPVLLAAVGMSSLLYAFFDKTVGNADVIQAISLKRAFLVGGGYALLLLACALQEVISKKHAPRLLAFIGDISYSMYLSHILTLSVCGRIWSMLGYSNGGLWSAILFWTISYSAVILVSFISYQLVERRVMQVSRRARRPLPRSLENANTL